MPCRMYLLVLAVVAGLSTAQSPKFEVASVKPTSPDRCVMHRLDCSSGTGFTAQNQTLLTLIGWAYDLSGPGRIVGGPKWIDSPGSPFDVQGKVGRKVNPSDCRLMVQALLAERFQLAVHWENRELPVYVLSVSPKGSKLHETGDDPKVLSSVTINGAALQLGNGYARTASGRGMSMRELARHLTALPMVGRPVVDKTGLAGFYGFNLDYAVTLGDDTRPDIFAALREQLGLRLEAAKGPVGILVIDRAEIPSEN